MHVSVEEALRLIYENITPKRSKILPLELCLGHIIATDIIATCALPPYDNSAMDGYAVKCDGVNQKLPILKTIFAGDKEEYMLQDGSAYKIMTGAKIPFGTEAIIPIEDTQTDGDFVLFSREAKHGMHIRLAGEDIQEGDTIIQKESCLCAHHITLLASQGISHVMVYAKPRIALFASGSELKMHYEELGVHQLYNTNTPTFVARSHELGCEAAFLGTAEDSVEALRKMIETALDYDLIITSGGVSVGDADFTKEAFSHFNFETIFEKVDIKPGKPTTFGRIGNSYVLNLPGNPLAATLNFELFAKAAILALGANKEKHINFIETKMKSDFHTKSGKRSLIPGYFDGESFCAMEKFAPGMIMPMAVSNGFIMIDKEVSSLKQGDKVKFISSRFSFTCKQEKDLITY
jgi:molybdopterin molybdotransferase